MRDPRGQRRWGGRGRGPTPSPLETTRSEPKFKGVNPLLPSLNYGAVHKENRPIEFLQVFGEHCAINFKRSIAQAFWTSPPSYGEEEAESIMPDPIPNTNVGKAMLADYTSDRKEWKLETKKIEEHKRSVFALVYAQMSESSRSEVKDHEDWEAGFIDRDLLYLISRIRATHIARQSGNPAQDMERVRNVWATMQMHPHETSFEFRKRVEDYQLERTAVGLEEIPDNELIIGILNRLDMWLQTTSTTKGGVSQNSQSYHPHCGKNSRMQKYYALEAPREPICRLYTFLKQTRDIDDRCTGNMQDAEVEADEEAEEERTERILSTPQNHLLRRSHHTFQGLPRKPPQQHVQ